MDMYLNWPRFACAFGLSTLISLYGLKKRSLSLSGAVAAVVVGLVLTAASARFCVSLLTFFFTSSRLTKWRAKDKRKLEEDFREGTLQVPLQMQGFATTFTYCVSEWGCGCATVSI